MWITHCWANAVPVPSSAHKRARQTPMWQQLDRALGHFADLTAKALGKDDRALPGAGAAGGMGFAALLERDANARH